MRGHGCSKTSPSVRKVANAILRVKAQKHEKRFFLMKWNVFLQCRRQIFMSLSFFAEKSHFRAYLPQNHFFIASKNTNSVFSANDEVAEATYAQKLLPQRENVAKCNFKSKGSKTLKCFFLMKWNVFCNAEDRFSWVWGFLQEKVILELNCTKSLLIASKNTNSVFSTNDELNCTKSLLYSF